MPSSSRTLLPLLLLSEGVFLGVSVDSASLSRLPSGWWDSVFSVVPRVMPVSASIAAAGLLLAGPQLRSSLRQLPAARRWLWPPLILHLACFGLLYSLSDVLFNRPSAFSHTGGWVAAWMLVAVATLLSWVIAFAGPRAPFVLAGETGGLLLGSVAVGALAWAAGHYTQGWWESLRTPTLRGAYAVLRRIDASATVDPAQYLIGAGDFVVEVSTECSGYEGVGLLWIFVGTLFWHSRSWLRFPHALLLPLLGTAAVLLANVLRIAVLVAVGAHVSRNVAAGGFHSYAGVALFCAIALLTAAVAQYVPFFAKPAAAPQAAPSAAPSAAPVEQPGAGRNVANANPAAPFLLPMLATVAAGLLMGTVSAPPYAAYPVQVAVAAALLWRYRHSYGSLVESFSLRRALVPLLIGVLVFLIWLAVATESAGAGSADGTEVHALAQPWKSVWFLCRIVGAVVTVPIVEELAFRGYLARRLMSAEFETVPLRTLSMLAIAISSILFGMLHTIPLAGTFAGVGFAWAAKRRGSLADAVIAHAAANALLAAYVLTTRSWWLLG